MYIVTTISYLLRKTWKGRTVEEIPKENPGEGNNEALNFTLCLCERACPRVGRHLAWGGE